MSLSRVLGLLWAITCACVPAKAPLTDTSPRLIRVGEKLYVRHAPAGLRKDSLLYALSPTPLPGSTDHPKIGIVHGRDRLGDSLVVAWYTLPEADVEGALAGDGLPVKMIEQDMEARIGRHWGKYLGQAGVPFKGTTDDVIVEINLGEEDGLRPGDKYEVLGEPQTDALNRTIESFAQLGTCTVLRGLEATRARCQLDVGLRASKFDQAHWAQGGYVRAMTKREKR